MSRTTSFSVGGVAGIFFFVSRWAPRATPRFVVQRAQSRHFLAIEIELCRVLNAQHHRVATHAFLGLFPMRGKDIAPCHVGVSKKAVGRTGFAPAIARIRDAGRRVRRKSFHQNPCPLVKATISKIQPCKFLIRPALRYLGQCFTQVKE
jgi:hypothetical protein